MSETGPPSSSLPDPPDELVKFFEQEEEEQRRQEEKNKLTERLFEAVSAGARINFRTATSIETSLAGPDRAQALFERNRDWYGAPEVAEAILAACDGNTDLLDQHRLSIAENGLLIQKRVLQTFQQRTSNPLRCVIAEASAFHPDPRNLLSQIRTIAADCQCILPADRKDAQRVVPMLNPKKKPRPDLIYDEDLYERIRKAKPSSVGYIDQICVDQNFAHLGLAAAARYRALTHIIQGLNRANPIEHMIGMAFCIQGLALQNGDTYYLHQYEMHSISNMISLLINEHSKRCPATIVGRLRDDRVPVSFTYGEKPMKGHLLVDWYYLDHETAHVTLSSPCAPQS